MAPVFAGDYIEAVGEIVSVGNTSRKMVFEARKVIAPRPDINDSACDVLEEPIVYAAQAEHVLFRKTNSVSNLQKNF